MLKKNDRIQLRIDSVTSEGHGIGRLDGMAVFVPMTAPGDLVDVQLVKVQQRYCYGIVRQVIDPSPQRIQPDCPVFQRCGGCSLRHLDYAAELAAKGQWVADAVTRLGHLDVPVQPILPSPLLDGYRNKAQYPLGKDAQGHAICGFFAPRTHTLVPAAGCRLQPPLFDQLSGVVCGYLDQVGGSIYDEAAGQGLFRHLYLRQAQQTGQVMVCLVVNGREIPQPQLLIDRLRAASPQVASILLNHNTRNTNVILGDKNTLLWGSETITDTLCGIQVELSPHSFYQVNRQGAQQLYAAAARLAGLEDGQLLLDLYCGAGTIGLSMVRDKPGCRLIGVEIVEAAVENARRNATRAGIAAAEFMAADAGQAAAQLSAQGLRPHVVVVDPPRKGCDQPTLEALLAMAPQRIVYISCNPATLARDAARLAAQGYAPQVAQPVDHFPRTNHVETCVLLSHKNS